VPALKWRLAIIDCVRRFCIFLVAGKKDVRSDSMGENYTPMWKELGLDPL
jgi:hypothetical protein